MWKFGREYGILGKRKAEVIIEAKAIYYDFLLSICENLGENMVFYAKGKPKLLLRQKLYYDFLLSICENLGENMVF